jgi:DNA polymerase III alpha subunit (gram-positive type)
LYYIILDIEYITPQYKEDKKPTDLISIGAVCIENNIIIDKFHIKAKPLYRKKLNNRFTKLTGITPESLENECKPYEALKTFSSWINIYKNKVLCCWSSSDILVFHECCKHFKITNLVNYNKYFDIQKSYMDLYHIKNCPSLKNMLIKNEIITENEVSSISFHDALTDAEYTAKLFIMYAREFKTDINANFSGALYHNAFDLSAVR